MRTYKELILEYIPYLSGDNGKHPVLLSRFNHYLPQWVWDTNLPLEDLETLLNWYKKYNDKDIYIPLLELKKQKLISLWLQ